MRAYLIVLQSHPMWQLEHKDGSTKRKAKETCRCKTSQQDADTVRGFCFPVCSPPTPGNPERQDPGSCCVRTRYAATHSAQHQEPPQPRSLGQRLVRTADGGCQQDHNGRLGADRAAEDNRRLPHERVRYKDEKRAISREARELRLVGENASLRQRNEGKQEPGTTSEARSIGRK